MTKKILVIDDDSLVLKAIKKLLDREDYFAATAKSAKEGIEKAKTQDFNLIICDIRMPEVNGVEFTEQIKEICKNDNKSDIPIIFITGYASEETPAKALKLGIKDYILKPFDIDKLLESIKKNLL